MLFFNPFSLLYVVVRYSVFASAAGTISSELYVDFVHYFRYASSAYAPLCPKPNGQIAVKHFHDLVTDARGYVARDDRRRDIVVSFSGSATFLDTLTDVDFLLRPLNIPGIDVPNGVLVHKGFLKAWSAVASSVIDTIQSQTRFYPDYRVIFTGHSMGGAVASLAAMTLGCKLPSIEIYVYTYGQPRTGNDLYAYWVNEKLRDHVFRIVHTTDWIPNVIPRRVSLPSKQVQGILPGIILPLERQYRHHGIEYWQNPDPPSANTTRQCSPDGEDPACSNSLVIRSAIAHVAYFGIIATWPFCL